MNFENTHIWVGRMSLKDINKIAKIYSKKSGFPLSDYLERGNNIHWKYLRVFNGSIIGTDHPKRSKEIYEKDLNKKKNIISGRK